MKWTEIKAGGLFKRFTIRLCSSSADIVQFVLSLKDRLKIKIYFKLTTEMRNTWDISLISNFCGSDIWSTAFYCSLLSGLLEISLVAEWVGRLYLLHLNKELTFKASKMAIFKILM